MSEYKPTRMCVVCRKRFDKQSLIRLDKQDGKLTFSDKNGRGIYLCHDKNCLDKAINKKVLSKIVKCDISDEVYEQLKEKEGI